MVSKALVYPTDELAFWAKRLSIDIAEGREVYAYFNNDAEGYAIRDALGLHKLLGKTASTDHQ